MTVSTVSSKKKRTPFLKWVFLILLISVGGILTAMQLSPWPSSMLIRYIFRWGGKAANERIAGLVPDQLKAVKDLIYDGNRTDGKLDLYYPEGKGPFPLIVWVHGGGFIGGDKSELANYGQILASHGFVVAVPNYPLAPEFRYPLPLVQLNKAVNFLIRQGSSYPIDSTRIALAGDSGGAHIAAQYVNIVTHPTYASQFNLPSVIAPEVLKAVVLYCGPYNLELIATEHPSWFIQTVLWAYTGSRKLDRQSMMARSFSVAQSLSAQFPPTFISVGNNDPLAPHSYDLARKLTQLGIPTDSLFFPKDYLPAQGHEYQFDLTSKQGKEAFERTFIFLQLHLSPPP